ncbi:hypothetical protein [Infirmifilum uzonense]|uniref:hypothetical protein n=1 Tax=Infirmifilum uzonense TaxID=1550241 RepID=UPI00168CD54A|nr:hypothetical protein [Infirmifilum uzonense]
MPKPHSVWAFVILALYLAFLAFLLLYPILVPWSPPKESPPIIEKAQWRIAIVTEDPVFAELINSTIKAKELAVIPPCKSRGVGQLRPRHHRLGRFARDLREP